jgi:uncharacterized OB-fold protein
MSRDLGHQPATGFGSIYSFTVVRSPQPDLRGREPYVVAIVELDEGVRMMTNVVTEDPHQLKIGMRVRLTLEQLTPEVKLPKFTLA